ncbi:MAG: carboxypeptidase-like regulatory domain-containing protein [Acidimicrobiia bacterium]|nr:carboxypeptidase-like regulatory domain-containing protein [Acidimicrobiia bacterium]
MNGRRLIGLGALAAVLLAVTALGSPATAIACPDGQFSISGRVVDELTRAPLDRVTSVGFEQTDGMFSDGDGTSLPDSTFATCVPVGSYLVSFFADDYHLEWYDDAFVVAEATLVVGAAGEMVDLGDIDLLRHFPVVTGTVTDARTGAPLRVSVGLTNAATGASLDGEGTDANGVYRFVLDPAHFPVPGTYLISFHADSYWSEWYDDARRQSRATVLAVTETSGIIVADAELRACNNPNFCVPRHFAD